MHTLALIATVLVALIHVYIVLLETVLFQSRRRRGFGLTQDKADIMRAARVLVPKGVRWRRKVSPRSKRSTGTSTRRRA